MSNRPQTERTRKPLTKPAMLAIAVAVLLPLTAFAGIGAWNGVQKVMLGTAVELSPTATAAAAPAVVQAETSKHSQRGYLGVSTTSMSNQLRERFDVPTGLGVMITEVNEDTAAYSAGLEAGDVITRVDSTDIESTGDLSRAIRRAGADTTVALEIYRRGQPLTINATLGAAKHRVVSFSSHDWDSEEMEERMEAFAERMAEFGERFGTEFGDRFDDEWARNFEQNAEAFGERMEAWGEEFGRRMEERFENKDWSQFEFDGHFDEEKFAEAMERMHEQLENIDLHGIGEIVQSALESVDFESIGADVSAAIEEAMEAVEDIEH